MTNGEMLVELLRVLPHVFVRIMVRIIQLATSRETIRSKISKTINLMQMAVFFIFFLQLYGRSYD